jgi:enoyl-CoA hydratase
MATYTVDQHGAVAVLTLSRPELLNRFDAELHTELTVGLRSLRGERSVRAIVLASTGSVFSAGGDFELMTEAHASIENRLRIADDGRQLFGTLVDMPQPVIVALHGDAIGLGASLVLVCDAVVAARGVRISDPHVRMGLVAGDGGCVAWPGAVGVLRARRYLLTGDAVDAEEAWQWGMVTDLVDSAADVLPAALALAERIAALPPLAVQGTKRALNRLVQHRTSEVLDLSLAQEVVTLGSDDLMEAIAAFKEKRPGRFTGE